MTEHRVTQAENMLRKMEVFFPEFTWKVFSNEFPSHTVEGVEAQLEQGHRLSLWKDKRYIAELHNMEGEQIFRFENPIEVSAVGLMLDEIHKKHKAASQSGVLKNYVPWEERIAKMRNK